MARPSEPFAHVPKQRRANGIRSAISAQTLDLLTHPNIFEQNEQQALNRQMP